MKPVGPNASSHHDPLNEHEARSLVEKIAKWTKVSISSGSSFFDEEVHLRNDDLSPLTEDELKESAHRSQRLTGVDLKSGAFTTKPYFVPWLKSLSTGVPTLQIMFEAIRKLDTVGSFSKGLVGIASYLFSLDRPAIVVQRELSGL